MARILLADIRTGIDRLSQVLGGHHTLHRATTSVRARRILERQGIDLIVCGFHFDESKMINFLMNVRHESGSKAVPFVCFQCQQSSLPESCITAAMNAAAVLGASLCLDFAQVQAMSDDELRAAIETCLTVGSKI